MVPGPIVKQFDQQQGEDADEGMHTDLGISPMLGGSIGNEVSVFDMVKGILYLVGALIVLQDVRSETLMKGREEDLLAKGGFLKGHFWTFSAKRESVDPSVVPYTELIETASL
jgi:hypothetical protein